MDGARVMHLIPGPHEHIFTATPADRLRALGHAETGWAILEGDDVVGFFVLDGDFAALHDFAREDEIGLRSLLIDSARRGEGLGQAAMLALPGLVAREYPQARGVVLTCNLRNKKAYETYLRAGFADTGEVYLGGSAGPQHIMQLRGPETKEIPG
ncbi:MAG: GNAT family N-acetyltransferase [Cereibacter sphaeroides]|uniref:GNAT family N-acetyltransferase n=1 Tax=Cereibacter sphaeroides TaxID=1063 RepID=A0A2W5S4Z4_CERSP|nr:MAG: GNAT family N-acetyltransferase [Cereibacter sphaeroides]